LGWLDPDYPLADSVRLERAAAERALVSLTRVLDGHNRHARDICDVATGIVQVATAVMARALKRVSVARGIDPRGMALVPFGGAGPLFGCALADALGMPRVIIPPHPGVLSALGLATASERIDVIGSVHRQLAELDATALTRAFGPLLAAAQTTLSDAVLTRFADCRFAGQGYEVTVPVLRDDPELLAAAFQSAHRARHGHADLEQPIEVVNLRVVAERAVAAQPFGTMAANGRRGAGQEVARGRGRRMIVTRDGTHVRADVWPLGEMPGSNGHHLNGPVILAGADATGLIEPGWRGVVHPSGAVILERL
jgi:N-methylhydantoinase A